ncbi:MAG: hypothetical protein ABSB10_03245 [Candidatus Bathyarchaeia archaeon]
MQNAVSTLNQIVKETWWPASWNRKCIPLLLQAFKIGEGDLPLEVVRKLGLK